VKKAVCASFSAEQNNSISRQKPEECPPALRIPDFALREPLLRLRKAKSSECLINHRPHHPLPDNLENV
jgi:hypothetical protein